MSPPWWLQAVWTGIGLCLGWVVGAAGTWVGLAGGPLVGGVAAVAVLWGVLYWSAGRMGRVLGALLQTTASAGAAAALVMTWFAPLLSAWGDAAWFPAGAELRLVPAALAGVTLGAALARRAEEPHFAFPDAAALAELIGWPTTVGRWRALLGVGLVAAVVRAGLAAGWCPGAVALGRGGEGLAGLVGLAVAPGLLGLGLLLGRERVFGMAAGSLAAGAVVLPAALALGPAKIVAPALQAAAAASGADLQASFGPFIGLGAAAVAAVVSLGRRLRLHLRLLKGAGLDLRAAWRRGVGWYLTAALLGAGAFWRLGTEGATRVNWAAGWATLLTFLTGGALVTALGVAATAHLGSLPLPALGLPALAVAAPALLAGAVGRSALLTTLRDPPTLLAAGILATAAALFAADLLQTRRLLLLLEVKLPLYPLKLIACLIGLSGAAVAAAFFSVSPATAGHLSAPGAGLLSRLALAGPLGLLPGGLVTAGAGLGAVAWLLGRPGWPLALGALLPLPLALTLLAGGLLAGRWPEGARTAGVGLVLGDLVAQGGIMLLEAWKVLPLGYGRWEGAGVAAGSAAELVAGLGILAALVLVAALASWRGSCSPAAEPAPAAAQTVAGNAAPPG